MTTPHVIGDDLSAHWLRAGTIAWDLPGGRDGFSYRLHCAADVGDESPTSLSLALRLDKAGLSPTLRASFPHLADYQALRVPRRARRDLAEILTGQLAVASYATDGSLAEVTGLQLPGVLDDLYGGAQQRTLGPSWRRGKPQLAVWAPTAKSVTLLLAAVDSGGSVHSGATGDAEQRIPMRRQRDGTWTVNGRRNWRNAKYRFEVVVYAPATQRVETNLVTDPYSLGLTANSVRSLLVHLDDPALRPKHWRQLRKPAPVARPAAATIYELHVRDFSIADETVPAAHRGGYLAFTDPATAGMRHLRRLAEAGMTTVHLLPVNDIATIEEIRARQQTPDCDLASYPPESEEQQACVTAITARDGFNWGYDPLHYTTPEGSYATDPDGPGRTLEFRRMVAGLNDAGLRVVIDVVYNHTPASGQDPAAVLDRIVPGYYHRLSSTGQVESSTCCANTATEHLMMEKLMIDSVLTWATDYKVDGFRFDLMGHQPKSSMIKLRTALDRLTLRRDGVDGTRIHLYGEGWNFGEVADNARFVQATQLELAGTGIGTFNDRLRDAVRGGGPFDANPRKQGFGSGLYTDPNGDAINGTADEQLAALLLEQDRIRVGLSGNLAGFRFVDRTGATVTGAEVDYLGQPTGYTAEPREAISYVEAHDNETLYDALAYKLPAPTPMTERIRMQILALALTALGQGVSFWHAGAELLRSKSLDRDSFNSGDWFNVLDFSRQTNGFGRGLPPRSANEAKWSYMRPLLSDPGLRPGPSEIETAERLALELLRMRRSTPLFHLDDAELVRRKLSFPDAGPHQTPGVIVMRIDDTAGGVVDRSLGGIVVVFNATPQQTVQSVDATTGRRYRLHPVQSGGADPVVQSATHDRRTGQFRVPPRTVAVFVVRR